MQGQLSTDNSQTYCDIIAMMSYNWMIRQFCLRYNKEIVNEVKWTNQIVLQVKLNYPWVNQIPCDYSIIIIKTI
jgi:hypothetical protein